MISLKSITDIEALKSKKVLLRVDMNVPLGNDGIVGEHESWRIHKIFRTVEFLQRAGARVILLSHLGSEGESLLPIADYMQQFIKVKFIPEVFGTLAEQALLHQQNGEVILLENIRIHEGEEDNDAQFALELAQYGDIYINDAFSVSHRSHASIVGLPEYLPSYAGFQFLDEIKHLSLLLTPERPFIVIVAGVKFGTKLPLIEKFVLNADIMFVGGALAHPLWRMQGVEIGKSVTDDSVDVTHVLEYPNIMLPGDVITDSHKEKNFEEIDAEEMIMDLGPATIENLSEILRQARVILWNGPVGNYIEGYSQGTLQLAEAIAQSGAISIVGGGDTVAVLYGQDVLSKFTFVSTAGGAMLDFLVNGTLPGIEVLRSD